MEPENTSFPNDQIQPDANLNGDGSAQPEDQQQHQIESTNQQDEEFEEEEDYDKTNNPRRRRERDPEDQDRPENNSDDSGTNQERRDEEDNSENSRTEITTCCKDCTKDGKLRSRACICQVPSSQRRSYLGGEGCVTCHCTGCHPEDLKLKKKRESENDDESHLKNGCCKACMKAFSENKKACLCQVPSDVRMAVLPPDGCRICKCKGCHPDEANIRRRGRTQQSQRSAARPEPFVFGYNSRDYYRFGANPASSFPSHGAPLPPSIFPSTLPPFASPPSLSRHPSSSSAHHRSSSHHGLPPAPLVIHPLGSGSSSLSTHGTHRAGLANPLTGGTPSPSLRSDRSLLPSPPVAVSSTLAHPHAPSHHPLPPHLVPAPGIPTSSSGYPYPTHYDPMSTFALIPISEDSKI
eukprot:TRINITY_DN609_c0_g1_i1.p1 TRINITY_DN609_c0_g1~~TRINITY_DN609_c0_g1_i1.p1  ORF type:complete len:408 (+),score=84.46 TRINITY_DN609_c0_g1_i1:38-1261(+)